MLLRGRSTYLMRGCVAIVSVILLVIGIYGIAAFSADSVGQDFYEPYTTGYYENDQGVRVWIIERERITTDGMSMPSRMAIANSIYTANPAVRLNEFIMFVTTMAGSGIFGLLFVGVDFIMNKFVIKEKTGISTMSLLITMVVAAVLQTTLNTFVLQHALPAWRLLPFMVLWLPRVMQAGASTILITYFIAVLLNICERQPHLREWVR